MNKSKNRLNRIMSTDGVLYKIISDAETLDVFIEKFDNEKLAFEKKINELSNSVKSLYKKISDPCKDLSEDYRKYIEEKRKNHPDVEDGQVILQSIAADIQNINLSIKNNETMFKNTIKNVVNIEDLSDILKNTYNNFKEYAAEANKKIIDLRKNGEIKFTIDKK